MDEEDVCVHTHTHMHTHTVEYYSAMKKNEIMPLAATWIQLEAIMLSGVTHKEKDRPYITYMWNLKLDTDELTFETETELVDIESRLGVAKEEG